MVENLYHNRVEKKKLSEEISLKDNKPSWVIIFKSLILTPNISSGKSIPFLIDRLIRQKAKIELDFLYKESTKFKLTYNELIELYISNIKRIIRKETIINHLQDIEKDNKVNIKENLAIINMVREKKLMLMVKNDESTLFKRNSLKKYSNVKSRYLDKYNNLYKEYMFKTESKGIQFKKKDGSIDFSNKKKKSTLNSRCSTAKKRNHYSKALSVNMNICSFLEKNDFYY